MRRNRWIRGLRIAAIGIVAVTVVTWIVELLWNWLIPPVVGWHAITFWQAFGLLILSKILFGSFRGRPGYGGWRRRMAERWEHMTPEQREQFMQGMKGRCGRFEAPKAEPQAL
jgi:hypothetical protein